MSKKSSILISTPEKEKARKLHLKKKKNSKTDLLAKTKKSKKNVLSLDRAAKILQQESTTDDESDISLRDSTELSEELEKDDE